MDMRVTDPNLNLVASVGADWWRDANAPYVDDHSNNPGAGSSNWIKLSTEWRTLGFYSMNTNQFRNDLPPPLRAANTPLIGPSPDITPPTAPTIAAFTPDTGTVGDKITSASVLTLSGTAEAGSIVKVFDGGSQIGTAIANASGAWSFTTAKLSHTTHNFTATATDAAGNTSSASSLLKVRVDAARISPSPSSPMKSGKPLEKKSFEATSVTAVDRAALSGGDTYAGTAQTVAGQSHNLSLNARSWPGFTSSTTPIEISTDSLIFLALIFGAMIKIGRNGSLDRGKRENRDHPR
jgi:hypothetical protein